MKLQELKTELERRIADVDSKIKEVENARKSDTKNKDVLQDIENRLKAKRDEIILEYDQISAMEKEDKTTYPKLRSSVQGHLSSFDSIYSRAGNLIGDDSYGRRNRSIDFKDPLGTE